MAKTSKLGRFLERKGIEISAKRYMIDAMGNMALGLFASLLIGTILNTVGTKLGIGFLTEVLWPIARDMTGGAIGVAVAYALKAPPLVLFSAVVTGAAGNAMGGPAGAFIAVLVATECGKLVSKETKVDILVTPGVTVFVGVLIGSTIGPYIARIMTALGDFIMYATTLQPFLMGVIISVVMGMVLTLPISSAALAMMLSLGGLAGGASAAGCCAQMVGFAVMSFRENGWGGLVAQGLGTSMLQVPNIIRNWKIWIPPTLASAITGPLATMVFKMQNTPIGSGMGTSGLVGQFGTYQAMSEAGVPATSIFLYVAILHFVLPAILTLFFAHFLRKWGWIRSGDLKLDLG